MNKQSLSPTRIRELFSRPANNLTLLEHAAIQIYAAMVSSPKYQTESIAIKLETIAHDAIRQAQVLLRECAIEQDAPFISDLYGYDQPVDPHPINTDG